MTTAIINSLLQLYQSSQLWYKTCQKFHEGLLLHPDVSHDDILHMQSQLISTENEILGNVQHSFNCDLISAKMFFSAWGQLAKEDDVVVHFAKTTTNHVDKATQSYLNNFLESYNKSLAMAVKIEGNEAMKTKNYREVYITTIYYFRHAFIFF